MRSQIRFLLLVAVLVAWSHGCGGDQDQEPPCAPDGIETCLCEDGSPSQRSCLLDRSGFGDCECQIQGDAGASDALLEPDTSSDGGPVSTRGDGGDRTVEDVEGTDAEPLGDIQEEDAEDEDAEGEDAPSPPECEQVGDCDDGDPCTQDICVASSGACAHTDEFTDGVSCDDEDPCTLVDTCQGGACAPGEAVDCADLDGPCLLGVCVVVDEGGWFCAPEPIDEGQGCEDGSMCTHSEICQSGLCLGEFVVCADVDESPCVEPSCDPTVGCEMVTLDDETPCDDESVCSTGDACLDGTCVGEALSCEDDGDPCTDISCDPLLGCGHEPVEEGGACDDGDPCSTGDSCLGGLCVHQGPLDCSSSDPCVLGVCDPAAGGCVSLVPPGCDGPLIPCLPGEQSLAPCDDGVCDPALSACVPCVTGDHCDVGELCEDHLCVPSRVCVVPGDCFDGDVCAEGFCQTPLPGCSSEEPCEDGVCDEGAGICVGCLQPSDCPDAWSCTDNQTCAPAICVGGACKGLWHFECAAQGQAYVAPAGPCDDGSPCSVDYCSSSAGCVVVTIDGPCDDEDACTSDDQCVGGACVGTSDVVCLDPGPCASASCDPATGVCADKPKFCDDSNPCTQEFCDPAIDDCLFSFTTCDDGEPCTVDSCNPDLGGCVFDLIDCDDSNPCTNDACDEDTLTCKHWPTCPPDGLPCTADCDPENGACGFALPTDCDDGDPCTQDACEPGQGCVHEPVICAPGDACHTVSCVAFVGCVETPVDCGDDNPCTDDLCDGLTGCFHQPVDPACDDGNSCTLDALVPETGCCVHLDKTCPPDEDACTDDVCDPASGACTYPSLECPPAEDACWTYSHCDPADGCHYLSVGCDDGEPCTDDGCDPVDGCQHEFAVCDDDGDACTVDACVLGQGCIYPQVVCEAPDACSTSFCDPDSGICEVVSSCDDSDPCTVDTCVDGGCDHTPDDGDPSCGGS